MATNFPSSQDNFTNPTDSDTLDSPNHASQHADVNDAVEAIETALLDGAPLHIDDANERVGIGTSSPEDVLHVVGDVTIEVSDDGSAAQPEVTLHRGSASPADGDYLGQVKFSGKNDAGQTVNYAKITGKISDVTDGTEDGLIEIANINAGSQSIGYRFTSSDLKLLNGRGLEVDGDVTVDTDTLHVDTTNDRVGIGTTTPSKELDVHGASNPEIRILSTDASDPALVFGDSVDGARASIYYDTSANDLLFRGYNNSTRMTIDLSGNVGIGTTSPADPLHVADATSADLRLQDTGGAVGAAMSARMLTVDSVGNIQSIVGNSATSSGVLLIDNIDGPIIMRSQSADSVYLATNNTYRIHVNSSGKVGIGTSTTSAVDMLDVGNASNLGSFRVHASGGGESFRVASTVVRSKNIVDLTTASAANVFISSTNNSLYRSTSSGKYKTDIETLDDEHADIVFELRPVWYRSTTGNDPEGYSYYGLIAEEVTDVDPRLVHFGPDPDCGCVEDEEGHIEHEQACLTEPESVFYERLVPHLINVVQRQQTQIDAQEARIEALETA